MTSTTMLFDGLRFAVIDVEGNGQQPAEMVEIAVVPVDGLRIGEVWSTLIRPSRSINPIVTRKVHGIRNADVADAPPLAEVAADILTAVDGRIPVAHNATVEHDVLRRQLPEWAPAEVLCTMRLAKATWPGLGSYTLDTLIAHANITADPVGARHRAGYDAHMTALLFTALAKVVGDPDQVRACACLPALVREPASNQGGLW